jgi:TonB family protein
MIRYDLRSIVPGRLARSLLMSSILLGAMAHAQTPPPAPQQLPPSPVEDVARVSILSRPSLEPVEAAFKASGLRIAEPVLLITYDADGLPTNIDIVKSSRDRALDRAIVDWAKQIRIATKAAGMGRIPFSFINDSLPDDAGSIPEIKVAELAFKPSLETVLRRFMSAPMSEASAVAHVDHDDTGRVTAVHLVQSSGNAALDQAILAWTKRIKLKPGAAGTGRLPFEFKRP